MLVALFVSVSACGRDPEAGEQEADEQFRAIEQDPASASEDGSIVRVSIADGRMMPRLGAGRSTIALENQGTSDCVLSVERRADMDGSGISNDETVDRLSPSSTPGRAGSLSGEEPMDETDASDGRQDAMGDAMQDTSRGREYDMGAGGRLGQNLRVGAGQASALVLDLEPGTYEIRCTDDGGEAGSEPMTSVDQGLLVMVSDDATRPASPPQRTTDGEDAVGQEY